MLISTLLGSCISIAIFDPENKSGGLNHFMLPTTNRIKEISSEEQGRYGNFAIELLINDMLKKGSKENLTAKFLAEVMYWTTADTTQTAQV